jgi:hypothetical protein
MQAVSDIDRGRYLLWVTQIKKDEMGRAFSIHTIEKDFGSKT